MIRLFSKFRAAGFVVLLASCGDTDPVPGSLSVSIGTPATDDGAVMFNIVGPGIVSVAPVATGLEIFSRLVSTDSLRVIVVGNITSGPVVSLSVRDINEAESYVASVEQVSNRDNLPIAALEGYEIVVDPVGGPEARIGGVTDPLP